MQQNRDAADDSANYPEFNRDRSLTKMNETGYTHLNQQIPLPDHAAKKGGQIWKYVLTVCITMLITFVLTAGIGLAVLSIVKPDLIRSENGDRLSFSFKADPETQKALAKLQAVYDAVNKSYFEELSDAELIEAMTRGLVNELDNPYTMYLTAEQNKQIEESMSGDYSGIGAFVGLNKDGLVEITEVIEGSPAEAAGIMVGDLFMAVDGVDVTGFNDITSVAVLVRGPEGTTVDLTLFRPSINGNITVTATRKRITTASVAHRQLTDTIGYIQVRDFSQNVSKNFIAAIEDLEAAGVRHLVIDLRNNTGGMASEVIDMLDYLLPTATIATLKGRDNGKPFEATWRSDRMTGVPDSMRYAILTNGITASASELFAGCLRDYGKAVIIGEQTFGKGSGTITITLEDGSAVNLTNFLYYLPGGESIEGVGLTPDQVVALPEDARGISLNRLTIDQDTQLFAAITALEKLE
jgi:carboxyl-terminal processing protease